jgi:hypothetical protein
MEQYARLEDFIELIGDSEATLRNCYAETFEDISSEEFVKMILVDAAFVIMCWDLPLMGNLP